MKNVFKNMCKKVCIQLSSIMVQIGSNTVHRDAFLSMPKYKEYSRIFDIKVFL
ncbi:hypothetical protein GCM10019993_22260 [Enterococcus pseudoavium]